MQERWIQGLPLDGVREGCIQGLSLGGCAGGVHPGFALGWCEGGVDPGFVLGRVCRRVNNCEKFTVITHSPTHSPTHSILFMPGDTHKASRRYCPMSGRILSSPFPLFVSIFFFG